ncbi:Ubiquitin conjugation factor E4 A [Desmophyllum pertusum]|uniref:Ubiquitin conjugation factor E4 A n=1 Tax=Desmophyllum pertusum TaxID=174260 RepID=A0A9W9Z4J0_9CNID|nr:Ubiquitin conjugation factor E4 A [Desmophyllum pertusum]
MILQLIILLIIFVFQEKDPTLLKWQKEQKHWHYHMQGDQVVAEFMDGLVQEHQRKDDLISMFSPVLDMLAERSKDLSSLLQSDIRNYIDILLFFAKHIGLTEILVSSRFWLPPKSPIGAIQGHAFEKQTLLGFLMGLTSMSRDPSKPCEFFQRPTEQSHAEMQATMANLRTHLDSFIRKTPQGLRGTHIGSETTRELTKEEAASLYATDATST